MRLSASIHKVTPPMWTRRSLLLSAATLPTASPVAASRAAPPNAASAIPPAAAPTASPASATPSATVAASGFPDKASFVATDITYLDSGSYHPISLGARAAIEKYLARRTLEPSAQGPGVEEA